MIKKIISIISPCYNESVNVIHCYRAVCNVFAESLPLYDFELIFADDFSTDDTPQLLRELAASDPRVKVIFNARNYGVYRSTFNALKTATGAAIVPMLPVDLQDPPEVIPEFVKHWEAGYAVVYGMRYEREEPWLMKQIRRLYYRVVSRFSEVSLPPYAGEFQLIDRSVLAALKQHTDYYPFIRAMIARVNANRYGIHYSWKKRKHGKTKHNLLNLFDHGINGLVSTSRAPLRLMTIFGLLLASFSFLFVIVQILAYFLFTSYVAPPGVSTLIVALFFFFGVMFVFMGIVGEYIAAIHAQVRYGSHVFESGRLNYHEPPTDKN